MLIPGGANSFAPPSAPDSALRASGLPTLIAAYGLFGFGYVITATFLVAIVRAKPELQALEAWIWVLFGFAAVPSVALWSWVGARIGLAIAFALACVTEAVGVAASVEWATVTGGCLSAVLLGGTFMGITALGLVGARRLSAGDARRTLAFMTAAFGLGQMIGPTFAGLIRDHTGSFVLPTVTAAVALVLAAILGSAAVRLDEVR